MMMMRSKAHKIICRWRELPLQDGKTLQTPPQPIQRDGDLLGWKEFVEKLSDYLLNFNWLSKDACQEGIRRIQSLTFSGSVKTGWVDSGRC